MPAPALRAPLHDFSALAVSRPLLQRTPEDPPPAETPTPKTPAPATPAAEAKETAAAVKRKDVVLLMDSFFLPAAKLFSRSATPVVISSPQEMAAKLKAIDFPVARLIVLAHSTPQGHLKFDSVTKNQGYLTPEQVAGHLGGALKSEYAPDLLDFRGCSIGTSPAGMEKIRTAVGARAAIGSTCFVAILMTRSVQLEGKAITRESQLDKPGYSAAFDLHFNSLPDQFGKAKACIVDKSRKAYFRAGGKLVSIFANPTVSKGFDAKKSVCFANLTTATVSPTQAAGGTPAGAQHCQLTRIQAPAAGAAGGQTPTPAPSARERAAPEAPTPETPAPESEE